MVEGIAGALGGPVGGNNSQSNGNGSSAVNEKKNIPKFCATPPAKPTEVPFWAAGNALGSVLASGMLENNPEWKAAFSGKEEELSQLMQALMSELTNKMAKSLDFLKEDDEEEKPGVTLTCNQ